MSDPLPSDALADLEPTSSVDRDAKIEQLLLAGLDCYFSADYDQAIHIWTRVLFLDRSHTRARAYIERARSAEAERHRQSDELIHTGAAALARGEAVEARRLLQAAIDAGASSEDALPLLGRIDRLERFDAIMRVPNRSTHRADAGTRAFGAPFEPSAREGGWGRLAATLVIIGLVVALGVWNRAPVRAWWIGEAPAPSAAPVVHEAALPLPLRGETSLARARELAVSGRLRSALAMLDQVRATDPQKSEADRLRSEIQRQLLALGTASDRAEGARQ